MTRVPCLLVCVISALGAESYATILDAGFRLSAGQEFVRDFAFYQGDSVKISADISSGDLIDELALEDQNGQAFFSRCGYSGNPETVLIYATGFYTVRAKNQSTTDKTCRILLARYNPDALIMSKPITVSVKTVCDTTWIPCTHAETLGVLGVDTAQKLITEKEPHLRAGDSTWVGPIRIPEVDFIPGYEPTVIFYAANVESDRALADAVGNIGLALLTGGYSLVAPDVSQIEKGKDFGWQLNYASLRQQTGTLLPYGAQNRVRMTKELIGLKRARRSEWWAFLNNSFSSFTAKDVIVRAYMIMYTPRFDVQTRPDSTVEIKTRRILSYPGK